MQMNGQELKDAIMNIGSILQEKEGSAYTLGYMESLLSNLLVAYVPARDWHRVIETINRQKDGIHESV